MVVLSSDWPSRSCDLTTLDFFCGVMWRKVLCQQTYYDVRVKRVHQSCNYWSRTVFIRKCYKKLQEKCSSIMFMKSLRAIGPQYISFILSKFRFFSIIYVLFQKTNSEVQIGSPCIIYAINILTFSESIWKWLKWNLRKQTGSFFFRLLLLLRTIHLSWINIITCPNIVLKSITPRIETIYATSYTYRVILICLTWPALYRIQFWK